jgi:hypothetical protein
VDLAWPGGAASLAARIDAAPESAHREEVVRLRCVVERAATRVRSGGRALGPAPMCLEQTPRPSLRT